MKKETKLFTYVLCVLIATLIIAVIPVSGEEGIYDSVLRLHVIANSDSPEDQALKLGVRDEILAVYGDTLAACTDRRAAEETAARLSLEMTETAENYLRRMGCTHAVTVTLSREEYPTRDYENVCMPAGDYCSLRIVIGAGEGKNWWCVLFPPMCVGSSVGSTVKEDSVPTGLSTSQYKMISGNGRYAVRLKVLELVESIFG